MAPLIWLVTATTSGLGSSLVESIVARGDRVIATGRNAEQRLVHLKSDAVALLDLDVTAGLDAIKTQVEKANAIWGKIDVLLNNAGVSAPKSIEEAE
jgi:NADP-dependent 3-hydroxy acid dehydrogenase YdfG